MVQNPKSDLCLWLVPGGDGKVRKVRMTGRRLLSLGVIALIAVVTVGFISADYTRVQLLRLKGVLSLQRVATERTHLVNENVSLSAEVEELKAVNEKVVIHQRSVKQRLEELRSILDFASSLGVIEGELDRETPLARLEDGIGGAEIDCDDSKNPLCSRINAADPLSPFAPASFSLSSAQPGLDSIEDIAETLDRYIEVIKGLPLLVPATGYVTSGFGKRRSPFSGKTRMHSGIDFSLSSGAEVYVSGDGVVKSVKRTSTYGLMVDVVHGRNLVTRYAHLSKAFVSPGERICSGEVLGLAGSTGRSTGPHLHYEVLVAGKQINPMRFFGLAKQLASFIGDA